MCEACIIDVPTGQDTHPVGTSRPVSLMCVSHSWIIGKISVAEPWRRGRKTGTLDLALPNFAR